MPTHHQTTIVSTTYGWTASGQEFGYRPVCICGWKGRKVRLSHLTAAEAQADQHEAYGREVARLTAPSGGDADGGRA